MSKAAKAKLKRAVDAAADAAEAARAAAVSNPSGESSSVTAGLANTVGGVVIGRPQLPPAEDAGEVVVLSHVLSPSVAEKWKSLNDTWKQRHNLHDDTIVNNLTLRAAVAATVLEACMLGSPNRVVAAAAGAGGVEEEGDYHPVVKELDVATALAELIVRQLISSSSSSSSTSPSSSSPDVEESKAVAAAIDLPSQLPYTDAAEAFVIPPEDPRKDLVGELGARATRFIPRGTLLGPYATYVCTKDEYKQRRFKPVIGAARVLPPGMEITQPMHTELDHDAFAADFVSIADTALEKATHGVIADAYGYGNLALAVNDPSLDPFGGGAAGVYKEGGADAVADADAEPGDALAPGGVARAKTKVNVHLVELSVHGFPFMFHVAVEDVAPGEELLTAYGHDYWEHVREGRVRLRAHMPAM